MQVEERVLKGKNKTKQDRAMEGGMVVLQEWGRLGGLPGHCEETISRGGQVRGTLGSASGDSALGLCRRLPCDHLLTPEDRAPVEPASDF